MGGGGVAGGRGLRVGKRERGGSGGIRRRPVVGDRRWVAGGGKVAGDGKEFGWKG
ncbi:hypothetical protein TIFTF001_015212 [Ficus carica]|uniref:Uncharacterized protein n=1 Tax=Ficus carica TaxID=3494 RepID=A0AA88A7E2_FICCA|nr:hypothetical protein TIFTF001_015212 [Ficus carica]